MAADLRTFAAFGVHGLAVASLVTSQTTSEFRGAAPMSPEFVLSQLEALLDDVPPATAKVAMLWSMPIASVVADVAESGRLNNLVVDPVLADGSGRRIVEEDVDEIYRRRLLPAATVVTPNWVEAGFLLGREIGSTDEAESAAVELLELGAGSVVVTGGGGPGNGRDDEFVIDVVASAAGTTVIEDERLTTDNVRGSGDTFSAAIAAELAKGSTVEVAIDRALRFTRLSIERGLANRLGPGRPFARQQAPR